MKVLVLGVGVVGTLYGWALSEAGHDVAHFVRPHRGGRTVRPLEIDLLDARERPRRQRRIVYTPHLVTSHPSLGHEDLILVTVRHDQLSSALPIVHEVAGDAPLAFLMALWEGIHELDAVLPRSRYVWGMPYGGGAWGDATLDATLFRDVRLGVLDKRATPVLERVATLLSTAGLRPRPQEDMERWLHVLFAIDAALIGAARKAGGVDRLFDDLAALRTAVLAVRDALQVCERRGANVRAFRLTTPFYLSSRLAARVMRFAVRRDPAVARLARAYGRHPELDGIFWDVLSAARQLDVDVPRLEGLASFVPRDDETAPAARTAPVGEEGTQGRSRDGRP